MIVSFSVSNFRSFSPTCDETISFVASRRLSGNHDNHVMPIPNSSEQVLKTAVLYGANGAGKSNLFHALSYLQSVVLNRRNQDQGTRRVTFRFLDTSREKPTELDIQFVAAGRLYRYGIQVDDQKIVQEWLLQVVRGKEKVIFERITLSDNSVKIESGKAILSGSEKLKALTTIGGPANQSFLATIRATLSTKELNVDLKNVISWFEKKLVMISPDDVFRGLGVKLTEEIEFLKFAGDFLKASSTGVSQLTVDKKEITEDELRSHISEEDVESVKAKLSKKSNKSASLIYRLSDSVNLLAESKNGIHFYRLTINAFHESNDGSLVPLELREESDGTRRLLDLMPALHHLTTTEDAVFVIDEIDRSMHPLLVWKFMEFFLNSCLGRQQLFVTTHESNLLNFELLRRDEIWFAEKDSAGATRIYSLNEYQPRKDLDIQKHYLHGRFGAIPFLGNIDNLISASCNNK